MMTATVELDETRMCNLLGNELTQLPRNEEIIRGSNQQRRVSPAENWSAPVQIRGAIGS